MYTLVLIIFLVGVKLSLVRMSVLRHSDVFLPLCQADHFLASGKHGRISTEPVV